MLTLNDVYKIEGTKISFAEGFRSCWVPEVLDMTHATVDEEVEKEIDIEGRIAIRALVRESSDGYRVAEMNTVWFDGKPVMIVKDCGRSARDDKERLVTDSETYYQLCAYLRSKLKHEDGELDDFVDPNTLVYPEEIFRVYGDDYSTKFGYQPESTTEGYLPFFGERDLIPNTPPKHILVEVKKEAGEPAAYIRRYGYIMKYVRAVTQEELDRNPRIEECAQGGPLPYYAWYQHCERPDGAVPILKV